MPADRTPLRRLAVIGAGPRGIAVIERLVAASRTEAWRGSVEVHLIDPHVDRGGAVWRTDQSRALLMNTATCQTTMYPDASCAPVLPVEGAQTLAEFLGREDNGGYGPADIAPRAEHGRYLLTVFAQAEAAADPSRLRIVRRAAEARDVTGPLDGPQRVHLGDGEVLEVDAVVLALGHLATAPSPRSRRIAEAAERLGLLHVPSANPLEVDYTALLGRERVAIQGMGLNFYDAVGMLCEAAGGRFLEDPSTPSGLRYLPGGAEPQLLVGSRTGVVYRPKPDLRPHLPAPYEPTVLTDGMVESLAARPFLSSSIIYGRNFFRTSMLFKMHAKFFRLRILNGAAENCMAGIRQAISQCLTNSSSSSPAFSMFWKFRYSPPPIISGHP